MQDGEEEDEMPPNSTQNLNAKLTLTSAIRLRPSGPGLSSTPPPMQSSAAPNRIVGGPAKYRGGYYLSF
jgi:hypothetical protein